MNKYDIIFLPPEDFYLDMGDLYIKHYNLFKNILKMLRSNFNGKKILVKYRSLDQKKLFETSEFDTKIFGKIINFCNRSTIIIGVPGSAAIECLRDGYDYFCYKATVKPKNVTFVLGYTRFLCIANNETKLLYNIKKKKIFKKGYRVKDILHKKTLSLKEIVEKII